MGFLGLFYEDELGRGWPFPAIPPSWREGPCPSYLCIVELCVITTVNNTVNLTTTRSSHEVVLTLYSKHLDMHTSKLTGARRVRTCLEVPFVLASTGRQHWLILTLALSLSTCLRGFCASVALLASSSCE